MTREEAKEWLPIIEAWAEGKPIQYQINPGSWVTDINKDLYTSNPPSNYRVKPEPKYRPFQSQEECWNEMLKHQPFGWIKNNVGNIFNIISIINQNHAIKLNECYSKYSDLFKDFKFTDGTPFGIRED
ncbi:MAG: hypothetical protein PUE86_09205 [Prevotella sp.]|nr:hypothetical protein [Prevotella sp.]